MILQAQQDDDPIAQYHASEDTIARKVREMLISVQMEKQYSKPEILQGYLNIAQFGGNSLYGAGIREATQYRAAADERAGLYFGCGISRGGQYSARRYA